MVQSSSVISKLEKVSKKMKARLVAKDFQEVNQRNLRKDSPTCLSVSLKLVLSIAVSSKKK